MKLETLVVKYEALLRLTRRQILRFQTSMRYELRFLLCGFLTFLAYITFKGLSEISIQDLNTLFEQYFFSLPTFIVGSFLVIWAYVGLALSILAAALFNSLLPKT